MLENDNNPIFFNDFYKQFHREQYPQSTRYIYSTFTPRSSQRLYQVSHVASFGIQAFIQKYLIEAFQQHFFAQDKDSIVQQYRHFIQKSLLLSDKQIDTSHIEALHDLSYLPIEIKAIREGCFVQTKTPILTIRNTQPEFFWLTNYLETLLSCSCWLPITSATTAAMFRTMLNQFALETVGNCDYVDFQLHDFSMRGMSSLESAKLSGAAHLVAFKGTDSIPAIHFVERYYPPHNAEEAAMLIGSSIPATEHSVMTIYGRDELAGFAHLINEVYPHGALSIVADTYDFWHNIRHTLPALKAHILARDGKIIIRPDSGNPLHIVCGDPNASDEWERAGLIESLYRIFGGSKNAQGYLELDPHIGAIYGDSISLERAHEILSGLKQKGFAANNIAFGVGSLTYQARTRDSLGFAVKATHCVLEQNGILQEMMLFKDPKTDSGKRSQKGMVKVLADGSYKDELWLHSDFSGDQLQTVFLNGALCNPLSFQQVRNNFQAALAHLGKEFCFTL